MTTAVIERREYSPAKLEQFKQTVAKGCSNNANLVMYLHDCERQGVHPLDRLIHYTERDGKYTPITSIDLFRARAAEAGDHAGTDDPVYSGEPMKADFAATVTVYRIVQGQRCSWTATARWGEYYPGDKQGHMWRKMPYLMLGKCAEALCLRKAFPRQLHGLYIREEMAQGEIPQSQLRDPNRPALPRPAEEGMEPDEPITPEMQAYLRQEVEVRGRTVAALLSYLKCRSIEAVTFAEYADTLRLFEQPTRQGAGK